MPCQCDLEVRGGAGGSYEGADFRLDVQPKLYAYLVGSVRQTENLVEDALQSRSNAAECFFKGLLSVQGGRQNKMVLFDIADCCPTDPPMSLQAG